MRSMLAVAAFTITVFFLHHTFAVNGTGFTYNDKQLITACLRERGLAITKADDVSPHRSVLTLKFLHLGVVRRTSLAQLVDLRLLTNVFGECVIGRAKVAGVSVDCAYNTQNDSYQCGVTRHGVNKIFVEKGKGKEKEKESGAETGPLMGVINQ